jgi:hypothetical protein
MYRLKQREGEKLVGVSMGAVSAWFVFKLDVTETE